MSGWIKLRRNLKYWEWYDDHNATRLLIHLLISVNYKDKKWRGILIKSGSMVLSWKTLSDNSFMTVRQCRTAMDKLVKSKEVTRYVTNKFQVVTLLKWEQIQIIDNPIDKLIDKQVTDKGQTNDKQVTPTKEYKEVKEDKEDNKTIPSFSEFVEYATRKSLDVNIDLDFTKLKLKYESWKENNWCISGKRKRKILNWKTTLLNTLNYLKKEKSSAKKEKESAWDIIQQVKQGTYERTNNTT